MSRDYCFIEIDGFDTINGVEVPYYLGESSVMGHPCHHYLAWDDIRGNEARQLTSPGSLTYAIGTGDDFHCFDHARLPDGRIVLHSVINSETGSFIMTAGYEVVPPDKAVDTALGFTDQAIDWLYQGGNRPLRHHQLGWNQDEYFWVRQIAGFVCDPRVGNLATRRIVRDPRRRISWLLPPTQLEK